MSIKQKLALGFTSFALIFMGAVTPVHAAEGDAGPTNPTDTPSTSAESDADCTSILPGEWCDEDSGNGVFEILNLVLNIMTAGIGIIATIGLIIVGIQWMTARDKEDQIVKAKSRLQNIVIGILVWGLLWLFLSWLIPGGVLNTAVGAII